MQLQCSRRPLLAACACQVLLPSGLWEEEHDRRSRSSSRTGCLALMCCCNHLVSCSILIRPCTAPQQLLGCTNPQCKHIAHQQQDKRTTASAKEGMSPPGHQPAALQTRSTMKHCLPAGRTISSHWCFTAWTPAAPTMGHPRRGQSRHSFCLHLLGLQLSLILCIKQGKVCLLGFAEPAAQLAEVQEGHATSRCLNCGH